MTLQLSSKLLDCQGTTAIAVNPGDCRQIIVACEESSLHFVDIDTLRATNHSITVDSFITSLSWQPPVTKSHSTEELMLVAGCSNGSIVMYKPASGGKHFSVVWQKKIVAHEGSVTNVEWSPDGTSLLTAGEDGEVKIWSQTGHLRSKVARFEASITSIAWHRDSCSVVVAHNSFLSIHHVQNNGQNMKWNVIEKKEENIVILAVDWNNRSNLIICGGEDCKYHVFDSRGILLMTSHTFPYPVTSIAWLPNGEAFVIGSFGTISICDKKGENIKCVDICTKSSVIDLECSSDSAQVFGSCCDGHLSIGYIVSKNLQWNGIVVEQVDPNQLRVDIMKDLTNEIVQIHRGPIIDFKIASNHLIVFTRSQCHIYHVSNLKSEIVIDIDGMCCLSSMGATNFVVAGNDGIAVYSYSGRKISSIQDDSFKMGVHGDNSLSITRKVLAIIDSSDHRILRMYHCEKGKPLFDGAKVYHETEVLGISLSHFDYSDYNSGHMALLDKNKDLFILSQQYSHANNSDYSKHKIASHVDSMCWNETNGSLACLTQSKVILFQCPAAPFIDIDLFEDTIEEKELDGCEKGEIVSFHGANLIIRRSNGVILQTSIAEDTSSLFENSTTNKWKESMRFCQYVDRIPIWATLACLALKLDQLEIAELALIEVKRVDKVDWIEHIRSIPDGTRKQAEIQLQKRNLKEAIAILLQGKPPLQYRAIKVLIQFYKWDWALDVALESKEEGYVDVVLYYRANYLRQMEISESSSRFRALVKERSLINQEQLSTLKSKLRTDKKNN